MLHLNNNNNNNNNKSLGKPSATRGGTEEKGPVGSSKQGVVSPPIEEETAAALAPRRRTWRVNSDVTGQEESEGAPPERMRKGEARRVLPQQRQRQQVAGEEVGGPTTAPIEFGGDVNPVSRAQREGAKQRLLLSCSHVFHKAVGQ